MRQLIVGILAGTILVTSGCNNKPGESNAPEDASAPEYFTVRAGPVANARIEALDGTFQMLKVAAANGIPSQGRGGACLVFPAADLGFPVMAGKTCNTNSDCTVLPKPTDTGQNAGSYIPPSDPTHRENRFGYCHQASHQCWSKPIALAGSTTEPPVCNRPITMTAATLNHVPPTPVDVRPYGIKKGTKVRVVACVQKTGAVPGISPTGTGCASNDGPDRIEDWGPEDTVK